VLHLFGLVMALRKRRESPVVRRAAATAFSLGVLQLLVAGAMIGMRLPPVLRSLHEATGVSIWIAAFTLAYLARIASGGSAVPRVLPSAADEVERGVGAGREPGAGRAPIVARTTFSTAVIVARGSDS
jgi:hypothetical protein